MNSLRFLLVHRNPEHSKEIASLLARANHSVLPTTGFEQAADALSIERFDAVLMAPEFPTLGLEAFSEQLRKMEKSQRSGMRVPVIALGEREATPQAGIDGTIPEPIDPDKLTREVVQLAHAVQRNPAGGADAASLEILDPEKFKEQVGFDDELMREIIDLFLEERKRQEPEMQQALMEKQFEVLSRLAHTIKGSLGSLHAMRARAHAQELEFAAKHQDEDICWASLAALESDLAELEPELLALR